MSQQNLMIHPTLSSNISFHTDAEIYYVDMTALFKQEKKHRLRHSHPTHITCMWFLHFIVEVQNRSGLPGMQDPGPFVLYKLLTSTSVVSQSCINHRQDLLS